MKHKAENPLVISNWSTSREAYRSRHLRQGLYDGGVVMDEVLINLHGLAHRDRRRLENPLFRRDVLFRYERERFPSVLHARLHPHIRTRREFSTTRETRRRRSERSSRHWTTSNPSSSRRRSTVAGRC